VVFAAVHQVTGTTSQTMASPDSEAFLFVTAKIGRGTENVPVPAGKGYCLALLSCQRA